MDKKIEEKEEEQSVFMVKTERSGKNCLLWIAVYTLLTTEKDDDEEEKKEGK